MKVHEVVEVVRSWVRERSVSMPGFVGAHLKGSLLELDPAEGFPSWSDVDVNLVVGGAGARARFEDVTHRGLLLDVAIYSPEVYSSPETLLANASIAPNLARGGVIVDPRGELSALQRAVAAEYRQPRWVRARCIERQRASEQHLARLATAEHPPALALVLWYLVASINSWVALAWLEAPTHRRGLIRSRRCLERAGRSDLHESLLRLAGYQDFDPGRVAALQERAATAFDLAASLDWPRPTGDPASRLIPQARSYVVDGARRMLADGDHREALLWITPYLFLALQVIERWAPPAERSAYRSLGGELLAELGLHDPDAARERAALGEELIAQIAELIDHRLAELS